KKVAILVVGIGKDAIALRVALAAGLFATRRRLGDRHGDVAVGAGADGLGELVTAGADFRRFALALGLHALKHRLAVRVRQVGAANADIDDVNAEIQTFAVHLVANA